MPIDLPQGGGASILATGKPFRSTTSPAEPSRPSMSLNRRDFLKLRTHSGERTLEISCQRLRTSWLETKGADEAQAEESEPAENGDQPTRVAVRTADQLFQDLEDELLGVDVLSLVDRRWLSGEDDELRRRVGELIELFRSRGGRVEYSGELR